MNRTNSLQWTFILSLGALALLRPLIRIVQDQLNLGSSPATPIIVTLIISAIWIFAVGFGDTRHPVLTLVLAGVTYGVLSIILSGILSPILTGELQGPIARPITIIPVLLTNSAWGLTTGGIALMIQKSRGDQKSSRRTPSRTATPV